MSKRISQFRHERYGLFIDLADGGHVGIDPESGDMFLDEGVGEDRFHGAVIPASDILSLELQVLGGGPEGNVLVRYGTGLSHNLGVAGDVIAAKKWVDAAYEAVLQASRATGLRSRPRLFTPWRMAAAAVLCLFVGVVVQYFNLPTPFRDTLLDVPVAAAFLSQKYPPEHGDPSPRGNEADPEVKREYRRGVRIRTLESGTVERGPYVPIDIRFSGSATAVEGELSLSNVGRLEELIKTVAEKGTRISIEIHNAVPADSIADIRATDKIAEILRAKLKADGFDLRVEGFGSDFSKQLTKALGKSPQNSPYILIVQD